MRKWLVPVALLGAGGVGAFLASPRGREMLRRWRAMWNEAPERWDDWNDTAQMELDRIQATLNQIAQSLEPHGEPGQ